MKGHDIADLPVAVTLMLVLLTTGTTLSSDEAVDGCSREILNHCLEEGNKFVKVFVKRELEQRGKKKIFDKCKPYEKFHDCITPIINTCQAGEHDLHHWLPLVQAMDGLCNFEDRKTNETIDCQCLTREYDSVLSYQCDEYYKFNIDQKTRHKCHFANERIHCREALVSSSCTPETGVFLFHVLKLETQRRLGDEGVDCTLVHNPNYSGLRYDATSCTTDLVERIDMCANQHLIGNSVINFREESDIVVTKDDKKHLKEACSSLRSYHRCIQPIRQGCPHGAKIIFDYAEPLKKYLLKMDYICQDHIINDYKKNINCMNKVVLGSRNLSVCDGHWKNLDKVKEDISSYNFYCNSKHHKVQQLMTEIDELQSCYSNVFEKGCPGTGDIVRHMLQKVFQDPLYLRFTFEPDCDLHQGGNSTDAGAKPISSATTIAVHLSSSSSRSQQHRNTDTDSRFKNRGKGGDTSPVLSSASYSNVHTVLLTLAIVSHVQLTLRR